MKESLMEIICCPMDKHDLELTVENVTAKKSSKGHSPARSVAKRTRSKTGYRTCCRRICAKRHRPELIL